MFVFRLFGRFLEENDAKRALDDMCRPLYAMI